MNKADSVINVSDESGLDSEYFLQIINDKLDTGREGSYLEVLAMKQMGSDFDPEEELQNALDEIQKNEKETHMIAMVAQTLFEKSDQQHVRVQELEDQVLELTNGHQLVEQNYENLLETHNSIKSDFERTQLEKNELDRQLAQLQTKRTRIEKANEAHEKKIASQEE